MIIISLTAEQKQLIKVMKPDSPPDKSTSSVSLLGISQVLTMAMPRAANALLTCTAESI